MHHAQWGRGMDGAQSELAQAPGPHRAVPPSQQGEQQSRGEHRESFETGCIIELIHSRSF